MVLITLDTTRADHLGLYGYSPSPSPNLDRFAQNAVVYTRAYSASSWTLPSHASMFTGLFPTQHGAGSPPTGATRAGMRYTPLLDDYTTLAELFSRAGYRTAAVVGGPALDPELGLGQGFERYEYGFASQAEKLNGKRGGFIADRGIAYIEEFRDEPYFLFLNFFDPHRPYRPTGPTGRNLPKPDPDMERKVLARTGSPPRSIADLDPSERQGIEALLVAYVAEIRFMDEHLGRLLKMIKALPPDRRPFVAITSDHGESFGEHYSFTHGLHLYEDNTRVPLILYDPNQSNGARIDDWVSNKRLFATLLGVAGIEPPRVADSATLNDPTEFVLTELWRTANGIAVFGEGAARDLRAFHTPPYKMIESSNGSVELYDLDNDPEELINLASASDEMTKQAESMRKRLDDVIGDGSPLFEASAPTPLGAKTKDALRALGYTE